jgi:hypothetical protein
MKTATEPERNAAGAKVAHLESTDLRRFRDAAEEKLFNLLKCLWGRAAGEKGAGIAGKSTSGRFPAPINNTT